jgi:hypothetical protein
MQFDRLKRRQLRRGRGVAAHGGTRTTVRDAGGRICLPGRAKAEHRGRSGIWERTRAKAEAPLQKI